MKFLKALKFLRLIKPKSDQRTTKPLSETVNENIKDYRATKTARLLIYLVIFLVLSYLVKSGVIPYHELITFIVNFF